MYVIAHYQNEDPARDPNKVCMQTGKQSRMHIKPLENVQFTLIKMKKSVQIASVFINLIIVSLLVDRSEGDPRSEMIKLSCSKQIANSDTQFLPKFVKLMTNIGTEMRTSRSGTAIIGTEPHSIYGLAECYGDLSAEDCILCYAEARSLLPHCFPYNGGQIFLDGCFMRTQNYSFFEEYAGPDDTIICGNTTTSGVFQDSVRQAVSNAVRDAPRNSNYFARELALSGKGHESAYALADCWKTLNESSCRECLERASASILQCLPWSEGRALHTGCFMRYSNTNFLNPEQTGGNNGEGNAKSQVIQLICENQQENNQMKFVPNFVQAIEEITIKMRTSRTGTTVTGTEPDSSYGLAQCYGDFSTRECVLCYAEARTSLPSCLPNKGGRVYLNGCFMRFENYSFFEEDTGPEDRIICDNKTRKNNAFEQSASKAVFHAVENAPKSNNYHASAQALISGTANKSAYAVADCWRTLDADACAWCLQKAARSMLGCLPGSGGYALYTGCFMRYSDTNFLNPHHKRHSKWKVIAIVIALASSVVAFTIGSIIAFYVWRHRNKTKRRGGSNDTKLSKILSSSSLSFKYSTIEKATNSFDESNKLGQGGFGTVYKGVLPNGREIAVKRLFVNHHHRAGDFYNEVNIISSVDHKNLVKLVGFSCSGPESILIYEYLANSSLDHFIFDAVRGKELNWAKRFDIIIGTAEGLAYLHENRKTRIIHRDIKAANILLDSRLRAKIADFGLARSFQEDKNHISTGIAGTLGYMAPEYVARGQLTEKVDVYSFGVLLLEVVTGIPNRGIETSEDTHSLVSIAWNHFKQGSVEELVDPNLMLLNYTNSNLKMEIQSVVHIALLCTQEVPSLRPTMSMALQMLSKNIEPLPSPANPPYISKTNIQLNEFRSSQTLRLRVYDPASIPTISDSSFHPR